ncbi:MAG: hypothetical protein JO006_16675 [Paucibacter sp.]|nr:hypothetical protein [Roseateles sp.]
MRKFWISLLLPVLMLFTQQAQAWHEIGHLRGTAHEQNQDALGAKLCGLCFSFAHLDAATGPELPQLKLASVGHAAPVATPVASHESDAPAQGNRDPPLTR